MTQRFALSFCVAIIGFEHIFLTWESCYDVSSYGFELFAMREHWIHSLWNLIGIWCHVYGLILQHCGCYFDAWIVHGFDALLCCHVDVLVACFLDKIFVICCGSVG